VGVLPEALEDTPFAPELWVPIADTAEFAADHERRVYNVVGRMAGELPDDQVATEIGEISARLTDRYPETHENISGRVQTYREMYSGQGNQMIMFVMMGAVGFLLLIACANVANLLISRILHRGREIAVRSAMGASRWRLVRQLLVESLLMSLLAAVGGAVMAWWGSKLMQAGIERTGAPPWFVFSVGAEVYALVVVLAFATGILFGFAPALHAVRASAGDVLKESGRGNTGSARTRRVTAGLVVVQVMLAVILLAGAGVMTRSAVNVQRVDWGLDTDLLTVRLTLDADRYPDSENRLNFHRELEQRVLSIPGVEAMALTSSFPSRGGFNGPAELEDRLVAEGNRAERLSQVIVGANYFRLAGIEPLTGRLFNDTDGGDGTFPVVIEQRFAERFWPGEDPVGKRFRWVNEVDPQWMTVIGVAPRIMHLLPMSFLPDFPVFYTPYPSEPLRGMGIMVRASTDTETLAIALREAVRAIDPELPLYSIDPLPRLLEENTYSWQVVAYMFTVLGAIALVLSCMGIYAVMAFAIGRREQEIGVRMALGARAPEVVRLVMRVALVQTGLGLVLGLVGATLTTRLLTMFMYEVSPTDPLTFASAVGLLLLSAVVAGWAPARRASRVDPMRALQPD
jgi:predicted permease